MKCVIMNKFIKISSSFLSILFVVSILGCIDTNSSTPTIEIQQSDMSFTNFDKKMSEANDLTTLQKENIVQELSSNVAYKWEGMVDDVTQNTVTIDVMKDVDYYNANEVNDYYFKTLYYSDKAILSARFERAKITLHIDDNQKSQLNSISKGSIISFEGMLTPESIIPTDNYDRKKNSGINMYNGRIIKVIN